MEQQPLVTVITPTHNILENNMADSFNLLVQLLDMQTYPNIEHLIIDNASTDGTIEFLKSYKNQNYLTFYSEKDTGIFNAFNKGVMHAQGKYVTFLNCDDFIHDITAIFDIVNLMEESNADFTFAPAYCRHPEGFVFMFSPSMHNAFQVMPCARQAMFYKKSMIEKENYYDERFKYLGDLDFIMRIIMKRYKPAYYDTNYVTYTLSSQPQKNEQRAEAECKAIYNKMARYSEFPKPLLDKLVTYFPEADKELFYEKCEQIHQLRVNAHKAMEEKNT